jgi:hypothetical protein
VQVQRGRQPGAKMVVMLLVVVVVLLVRVVVVVQVVVVLMHVVLVAHHNPDPDVVVVPEPPVVVVVVVALIVARDNARRVHDARGADEAVGDAVAQAPPRLLLLLLLLRLRLRLLLPPVRRVGHRAGALLVVLLLHLQTSLSGSSKRTLGSAPSPLVQVRVSVGVSARCAR